MFYRFADDIAKSEGFNKIKTAEPNIDHSQHFIQTEENQSTETGGREFIVSRAYEVNKKQLLEWESYGLQVQSLFPFTFRGHKDCFLVLVAGMSVNMAQATAFALSFDSDEDKPPKQYPKP
jgi:hypothetical protein